MRNLHISHRRIAQGKDARKLKYDVREERALHANEIMREYEHAYASVYNILLELRYEHGWVHCDHLKPMRLTDVPHKTEQLWASVHAIELNGESDG